jgi:hypothetical protein
VGEASDYEGMTVNERLGTANLFDEFDKAARARDRATLEKILMRVALSHAEAESVVLCGRCASTTHGPGPSACRDQRG